MKHGRADVKYVQNFTQKHDGQRQCGGPLYIDRRIWNVS